LHSFDLLLPRFAGIDRPVLAGSVAGGWGKTVDRILIGEAWIGWVLCGSALSLPDQVHESLLTSSILTVNKKWLFAKFAVRCEEVRRRNE
jgi:hypothetical protein